MYNLSEGSKTD